MATLGVSPRRGQLTRRLASSGGLRKTEQVASKWNSFSSASARLETGHLSYSSPASWSLVSAGQSSLAVHHKAAAYLICRRRWTLLGSRPVTSTPITRLASQLARPTKWPRHFQAIALACIRSSSLAACLHSQQVRPRVESFESNFSGSCFALLRLARKLSTSDRRRRRRKELRWIGQR